VTRPAASIAVVLLTRCSGLRHWRFGRGSSARGWALDEQLVQLSLLVLADVCLDSGARVSLGLSLFNYTRFSLYCLITGTGTHGKSMFFAKHLELGLAFFLDAFYAQLDQSRSSRNLGNVENLPNDRNQIFEQLERR
jgi:hypothetical protein